MLSWSFPFTGRNTKDIFEKIKQGKVSFDSSEWREISREAKVFIKKMLTVNPLDRISAD